MAAAGTLSGVLLGVSMLPLGVGPVAFVALTPLLIALDTTRGERHAALAGYCCGLALFAIGFLWVPFVGDRRLSATLVYVASVPLLALPLAAYGGLLAWFRRFGRIPMLVVAAPLWVAIESARSAVELGSPWLHLGYALADHPRLIQVASLGGVHLVSTWIVGVNASLAAAVFAGRSALLGFCVGIAWMAPLSCAAQTEADAASARMQASLRVAAVQPHIAARDRHVPERFDANLRVLLALSERVLDTRPDLIVWPESAFERSVAPSGFAFLDAIGHHLGAPLLTGVWRRTGPGAPWLYNSALYVGLRTGSVRAADKRHPVPVYERAPGSAPARWLAAAGLWPGRFASGAAGEVLAVGRAGAPSVGLGALVCIDASYPEIARDLRRRGAEVLVTIANEADTGAWTAGLQAQTARLRAVENRVPVVRVANTGPSEWIDARGRVLARLAAGGPGAATVSVPIGAPASIYTQLGDGPLTALVLLLPCVVASAGKLRSRRTAGPAARSGDPPPLEKES